MHSADDDKSLAKNIDSTKESIDFETKTPINPHFNKIFNSQQTFLLLQHNYEQFINHNDQNKNHFKLVFITVYFNSVFNM